jgi:hypothetical protein
MSLTAPLLPAAQALGTGASEIIVAYASGPADIPQAWDGLQLPHLQALLATLAPTTLVQGDEMDFSPRMSAPWPVACSCPIHPG